MDKHIRALARDDDPAAEKQAEGGSETFRAPEVNSNSVAYPAVAERAEWSDVITLYDRQHFLTYARLLDAERDKVDWREGVREILLQDPDRHPERAWICWETHLERAKWIATTGFQQAVARASAH